MFVVIFSLLLSSSDGYAEAGTGCVLRVDPKYSVHITDTTQSQAKLTLMEEGRVLYSSPAQIRYYHFGYVYTASDSSGRIAMRLEKMGEGPKIFRHYGLGLESICE